MRKVILYSALAFSLWGFSQNDLASLLKKHNTETIPYISIEQLKDKKNEAILLDSREEKEYQTSHIKDAIFVGYDFFNIDSIQNKIINKESKIVIYCSIGIRSEAVALKLKKAGYKNVYNLYGGIFEWKNGNNKVFNSHKKETDSVHTFSKKWSNWLTKGIKVYD